MQAPPIRQHNDPRPAQMSRQALVAVFVYRAPRPQLGETVSHHQLIVARGEQRRRNADENGDPGVILVREGFGPVENEGDEPQPQVAGEVGRDGDVGETPHHGAVCKADDPGRGCRRDEWIGGIDTSPDYHCLAKFSWHSPCKGHLSVRLTR